MKHKPTYDERRAEFMARYHAGQVVAVTVTQVAWILGVSRKTAERRLPEMAGVYSISHGTTPRYRIPLAAVQQFKRERQVGSIRNPRKD